MSYIARERFKNFLDLLVWVLIILSLVQGCTWFFNMAAYENERYDYYYYQNTH